jgi:NDP-sugar pyrophosphorylase family protein
MIIIIPLGGKGERFKTNGYSLPKPLIKVFGKSLIEWVLDSLHLTLSSIKHVIIPYNNELQAFRFEEEIKHKYPHVSFLFFNMTQQTQGAAETIYLALSTLQNVEDMPILSLDGDNFYQIDILSFITSIKKSNLRYRN